MKTIDLNQSIHSMVQSYPEIKEILLLLGFTDIVKPGMLQTVGKFMTLKKGAELKSISLTSIKEAFKEKGFIFKEETNE